MEFKTIQKEIETFEFYEFSGGVDDFEIYKASSSLRVTFPPEYKEFLRELGSGEVSSEEFIGLGGVEHLNVVKIFNHLLEPSKISTFPSYFIPIRSDGYGNYDCIDTSKPTRNGEFMIVSWLHDSGDNQVYDELSSSYWEWFLSTLKMIREIDLDME